MTIDATSFNLMQTTSFEDMGYKSEKLSELTLLLNNPFIESEALINLHIIRTPGYNMGNWEINCFCNGVLVIRDMSTTEGEAWITFKIPTGCLDYGANSVCLSRPRGWDVMLLKDSNINIIQREVSSDLALRDLGFETNSRDASSVEFFDNIGNEEGKLMLHYMTITPGGVFSFGNWNLVVKLNDVSLRSFNGLKDEKWLEIAIPSGIINKGTNKLEFTSDSWPILILEDSQLMIAEQDSEYVKTGTRGPDNEENDLLTEKESEEYVGQLKDADFSPKCGQENDRYTFSVVYKDGAENEAKDAIIRIVGFEGASKIYDSGYYTEMTKVFEDQKQGTSYSYSTELPKGEFYFMFYFSNINGDSVYLPERGFSDNFGIAGPRVGIECDNQARSLNIETEGLALPPSNIIIPPTDLCTPPWTVPPVTLKSLAHSTTELYFEIRIDDPEKIGPLEILATSGKIDYVLPITESSKAEKLLYMSVTELINIYSLGAGAVITGVEMLATILSGDTPREVKRIGIEAAEGEWLVKIVGEDGRSPEAEIWIYPPYKSGCGTPSAAKLSTREYS